MAVTVKAVHYFAKIIIEVETQLKHRGFTGGHNENLLLFIWIHLVSFVYNKVEIQINLHQLNNEQVIEYVD